MNYKGNQGFAATGVELALDMDPGSGCRPATRKSPAWDRVRTGMPNPR